MSVGAIWNGVVPDIFGVSDLWTNNGAMNQVVIDNDESFAASFLSLAQIRLCRRAKWIVTLKLFFYP